LKWLSAKLHKPKHNHIAKQVKGRNGTLEDATHSAQRKHTKGPYKLQTTTKFNLISFNKTFKWAIGNCSGVACANTQTMLTKNLERLFQRKIITLQCKIKET
jgi:hypothetical protein